MAPFIYDQSEAADGHVAAEDSARARMRGVLFGSRLRVVLIMAGLGWLIFGGFRVGLLIAVRENLRGLAAMDLLRCLAMGMRYDAVPIGFAILPLVVILSLWPEDKFTPRFRRAITIYTVVMFVLALGVEIVGAGFFFYFWRRMNWMALNYPRHPREIIGHIWTRYPIWLLAPLLAAVAYLIYRIFRKMFWWGPPGSRSLAGRLVLGVVLTGLAVFACRGGFGHRPIRTGSAFFTTNNLVNQLTMNNFFRLYHAAKSMIIDSRDKDSLYPFPPVSEAVDTTCSMLGCEGDTPAEGEHPAMKGPVAKLWRRMETGRPRRDYNVVLIIMEGMSGSPVGALDGGESYTPNFDRLCEDGLLLKRMYAVGSRTSRALMGALCGHPDLVGVSVLERSRAEGKILTIPQILRRRGYRTMFFCGGDADFDNMRRFFAAGGVERFITQENMPADGAKGHWGYHDEVVFQKADEVFREAGGEKFFATILTSSNHPPYDIPSGRVKMLPEEDSEKNRRLNAYRYADWALGEFFRRAEKSDYFKNTIFVLVADHPHRLDATRILDVPGFRIPCLIYAPGIVTPRSSDIVCSQTDIAPTILALLGGRYEHCFMGRNLLNLKDGDGFAMLHEDGILGFVRGRLGTVLPPRGEEPTTPIPLLYRVNEREMRPFEDKNAGGNILKDMQDKMLSYYAVAREIYFSAAYGEKDRAGERAGR